jgi:hypothetical protein
MISRRGLFQALTITVGAAAALKVAGPQKAAAERLPERFCLPDLRGFQRFDLPLHVHSLAHPTFLPSPHQHVLAPPSPVMVYAINAEDGRFPSGYIQCFSGGDKLPVGWLFCDGRAVSRSAYPKLFAAIGTVYGAA